MNKKVLITGGCSTLGSSIAKVFAKNNFDIIITYHTSKSDAESLCDQIKKIFETNATAVYLDVTNEDSIKNLFAGINQLDCLVNNAAYNNDCDILDHTKDEFLKTLDTNLVGPFLMTKYAYELLKKSKGSIINIASSNGIDSMYPESIDYDASKAGLINLTKNLMKSFAPAVRVNAVAPGWIDTKKTEDMNPNFKNSELEHIALKRFASPNEVANVVSFLASDNASYINGSIIVVDGGRL